MFLTIVFEVPDGQADAYADAADDMIRHHAFAEEVKIDHWSFHCEMRPVAGCLSDTAPDLTPSP